MLDETVESVHNWGQEPLASTTGGRPPIGDANALPFSITARTNGTTEAIFKAVRNGEVIALVKHRIGNQRRREEIAFTWSEDKRLCNGNPLDAAIIAREIERLEAEVLVVIDEPDDEPLTSAGAEEKEKGPKQAELLVRLALNRYRIGQTMDSEAFAVVRGGANVAMMFRGSRDALRCGLARSYRQETGSTPSTNALAEALLVLQGEAMEATPEPVHLRVARHGDSIVIDLGDASGRAVVVRPGGWGVCDASPILFRRTGLTLALPEPERGGVLDVLKGLLNVTDTSWPLLRGWLVAALLPDIAHAIALLTGLQGVGKSVAARLLVTTIDPSAAVLRCEPRDPEQWCVSASASVVVAVDNISSIPSWWSDALCRAVSGDGMIRRRLYSDGDLTVLQFRRVVLLTSIDPGAMRGDLADRIMSIELARIPDEQRRLESEIIERFAAAHGQLFGAVLDLLAKVLAVLPSIRLTSMPRLADFARVLAAIDEIDGARGADGAALSLLMGQRGSLSADVIDSDPVGGAVVRYMEGREEFKGTAGDLLVALTPADNRPPKGWPANPRAMAARIKRLIPALRGIGIEVIHNRDRRTYSIQREITQVEPHQ